MMLVLLLLKVKVKRARVCVTLSDAELTYPMHPVQQCKATATMARRSTAARTNYPR